MILTFGNKLARDLVEGRLAKEVRRFTAERHRNVRKKLSMPRAARAAEDLRSPPGNRLEKIRGDKEGFYFIRINDPWRIVFRFDNGHAHDFSAEDYHT